MRRESGTNNSSAAISGPSRDCGGGRRFRGVMSSLVRDTLPPLCTHHRSTTAPQIDGRRIKRGRQRFPWLRRSNAREIVSNTTPTLTSGRSSAMLIFPVSSKKAPAAAGNTVETTPLNAACNARRRHTPKTRISSAQAHQLQTDHRTTGASPAPPRAAISNETERTLRREGCEQAERRSGASERDGSRSAGIGLHRHPSGLTASCAALPTAHRRRDIVRSSTRTKAADRQSICFPPGGR